MPTFCKKSKCSLQHYFFICNPRLFLLGLIKQQRNPKCQKCTCSDSCILFSFIIQHFTQCIFKNYISFFKHAHTIKDQHHSSVIIIIIIHISSSQHFFHIVKYGRLRNNTLYVPQNQQDKCNKRQKMNWLSRGDIQIQVGTKSEHWCQQHSIRRTHNGVLRPFSHKLKQFAVLLGYDRK